MYLKDSEKSSISLKLNKDDDSLSSTVIDVNDLLKEVKVLHRGYKSLTSINTNHRLPCTYINDWLLNAFGTKRIENHQHKKELIKGVNKFLSTEHYQRLIEKRNKKTNDFVNKIIYLVTVDSPTNNEIHVRFNPYFNNKNRDTHEDRENKFLGESLDNNQSITDGSRCILDAKDDTKKVSNKKTKKQKKEDKLDLSVLPKPTIFDKEKRRKFLCAGYAVELLFGSTNGVILTFTIPGSTDKAYRVMAKESGRYVKCLRKFIRERIGNDANYTLGTWEQQTRGALHLHQLVHSSNREGLQKIVDDFHKYCYNFLLKLNEKYKELNVDMFGRWDGTTWVNNSEVCQFDAQFVRLTAIGYCSKYLSKEGSKNINSPFNNQNYYYPTRWTNYGSAIKDLVKKLTIKSNPKILTNKDVEDLILMVAEIANQFSEGKYKKILVYKDKIGDAINIRIIVKPEHRLEVTNLLIDYINYLQRIQTNHINTNLPSYEYALEKQDNIDYMDGITQLLKDKFGSGDERKWLKRFKGNKATIPKFSNDEEWINYYAKRGIMINNRLLSPSLLTLINN